MFVFLKENKLYLLASSRNKICKATNQNRELFLPHTFLGLAVFRIRCSISRVFVQENQGEWVNNCHVYALGLNQLLV